VQPHPQTFWFGENPGKIWGNLAKSCKSSQNRCMCVYFTKMAPKMTMKAFFWRHVWSLLFLGKLGEIWASLGNLGTKMVVEVPCAKWSAVFFVFEVIFLFFFGQVCGNLGKNSSRPQKIACSPTYGRQCCFCLRWDQHCDHNVFETSLRTLPELCFTFSHYFTRRSLLAIYRTEDV